MEEMKEQMTIMMEAMMHMRKIIDANVATSIVVANTTIERDPYYSPGFNQISHPVLDVQGQRGTIVVTVMPITQKKNNNN